MKILYLHQYFNTPAMSGGTRSYEFARRLVDAGHEVHILTTDRGASTVRGWRKEHIDGITVHWYPVRYDNRMNFVRRIWAFFTFALAAAVRAVRVRGDLVYATSTPLTIAVPGVVTKRLLRVPMVFEVRDLWPELPIAVGALRNPIAKLGAQLLEKWAYRNSDSIVALSPGMAEGVARTGYATERISVIPNACDLKLFDVPDEEGRKCRAERPWIGSRPLVVYAGTFGVINDVTYLVEVAHAMLNIDPQVAFLAVGDGAELSKVGERAHQCGVFDRNFYIEESMPKSEMPALLKAATVCTSLFAPIPEMEANSANKFFDALAAGRPVAINYGGWQAELLKAHEIGVQLPRNPQKAALELHHLLSDATTLTHMARRSRDLASYRFGRDRLAGELNQILESVQRRWAGQS